MKSIKNQKNKLGYLVNYGDVPADDGNRINDSIVNLSKLKRFHNFCLRAFNLVMTLGAYRAMVQPASAIPPEAGEHIADAVEVAFAAGQANGLIPPYVHHGTVAGQGAVVPGQGSLPRHGIEAPEQPLGPGGPPAPGQPPIYMPIPRPITGHGRGLNTLFFTGSFAYICLNAYWGNPVAVTDCSVMVVGTWVLKLLGIRLDGG